MTIHQRNFSESEKAAFFDMFMAKGLVDPAHLLPTFERTFARVAEQQLSDLKYPLITNPANGKVPEPLIALVERRCAEHGVATFNNAATGAQSVTWAGIVRVLPELFEDGHWRARNETRTWVQDLGFAKVFGCFVVKGMTKGRPDYWTPCVQLNELGSLIAFLRPVKSKRVLPRIL